MSSIESDFLRLLGGIADGAAPKVGGAEGVAIGVAAKAARFAAALIDAGYDADIILPRLERAMTGREPIHDEALAKLVRKFQPK